MKYYVCFDGYGHLRDAVSEEELVERYDNDPDEFLKAVCCSGLGAKIEPTKAYVNALSFDSKKELNDYLESLGDEINGFYGGESGSRPYNF